MLALCKLNISLENNDHSTLSDELEDQNLNQSGEKIKIH